MGNAASHVDDATNDGWAAHAQRLSTRTLEQARTTGRLYLVSADLVEFPLAQLAAAELTGVREPRPTDPPTKRERPLVFLDLSFNQLASFPREPLPLPQLELFDISGNWLGLSNGYPFATSLNDGMARLSFDSGSRRSSMDSAGGAGDTGSRRGSFETARRSSGEYARRSSQEQPRSPVSGSTSPTSSGGGGALGTLRGTLKLGTRRKADSDQLRKAALLAEVATPDAGAMAAAAASAAEAAAELERELWAFLEEDEARKTAAASEVEQIVRDSGLEAALPGLTSLRTLAAEHNHLVHAFSVQGVARTLVCLKIGFNLLWSLEGLSERPLMQLEELYCNHNRLRRFFREGDLEARFPNLRTLDARSNNLDSTAFHGVLPRNLTTLHLGDNDLHTLPPTMLANQTVLTTLDLSGNQLESLPTLPPALAQLRTFNLARNALTALPDGWQHLTELQTLDLSSNRLTSLAVPVTLADGATVDHGIVAAIHLVSLDVSSNRLATLPAGLGQLLQLRDLVAASNQLRALPASLADLHRRLSVLILRRNRLGTEQALAPVWPLAALVELDLCANGLRSLPADINSLKSLSILRLSGNRLSELPDLAGLPCWMGQPLERYRPALYINDNAFTRFPESVLVLRSLHTLWMDSNPIVSVPAQLADMTGLRTLSVSIAQGPSRLAPLPGTITVGNISRLYTCETTVQRPPGPDGAPLPLSLPMFLDDTDVASSGQLAETVTRRHAVRDEDALAKMAAPKYPYAIAQLLGTAPHPLEDGAAVSTVTGRGRVGTLDYVALFDGHGGPEAVAFCQGNLHRVLTAQLQAQPENAPEEVAVLAALRSAFFVVHEQLRAHLAACGRAEAMVGTTAAVVLISPTHLYTANVGDTAVVLARHRSATTPTTPAVGAMGGIAPEDMDETTARSLQFDAVPLTTVHRPHARFEAARIAAGGGFVSVDRQTSACRMHSPNANNGLGVSRALGDFPMGHALSTEPSVRAHRRNLPTEDLFLVLACDGVTDVLRHEDMVVIAAGAAAAGSAKLPNSSALVAAAHRLRGWAYALDSHDDLSVIIVDLAGFFRDKP